MAYEEPERICFNCSYFCAACKGFTEYGICLEDEEFEPYIDEILEKMNYASCQDLIDKKKFTGESKACEKFDAAVIIEIDDDSPLGEISKHYLETGEIDRERLADEMYAERLKKMDWGELVGLCRDRLEKGGKTEKLQALRRLGSIVPLGSWQAFDALLDYLEAEPPPEKIEDVHTKIYVLQSLAYWGSTEQKARLILLLVGELYKITSNNTTRQWIIKIIDFLSRCPAEDVRQPLETLLRKRKFSPKMENNIIAVLEKLDRGDWFYE